MDMSHTVAPKSDQLNADDLIAGPKIIKILDVVETGSDDQPVAIRFEGDNNKPYKPAKSMRRVMISIWGKFSTDWIGQSIELYRDPDVKFGGQAVGGIRISKATGITKPMKIMLTVTRAKRAPYTISPLIVEPKFYPEDKFKSVLASVRTTIEEGKITPDDAILRLEKTAPLTEDQRNAVLSISPKPEPIDFDDLETDDIY